MMKFLADECCDAQLVKELRSAGHDVLYVMEDEPGITDAEVLEKAFTEERVLITEDKDFGELVYRLKKKVHGIILLRFTASDQNKKWQRLEDLVQRDDLKLIGNFIVVDGKKFRIRPL